MSKVHACENMMTHKHFFNIFLHMCSVTNAIQSAAGFQGDDYNSESFFEELWWTSGVTSEPLLYASSMLTCLR